MAYIVVDTDGQSFHGKTSPEDDVVASQSTRLAKQNAIGLGHLTVFNRKSHLHVIGGYPFQSEEQVKAASHIVATFVGTRVIFEVVRGHEWSLALYPQAKAHDFLHQLLEHGNTSGGAVNCVPMYEEGDCLPELG